MENDMAIEHEVGANVPPQIGDFAPTFTTDCFYKGEMIKTSLADYKGKWVMLFFYPLDFTFVCPTEIVELSKRFKELEELNCQPLLVSVDSVYSHQAWVKELGEMNIPMLSDMTKEISWNYGVLLEDQGISLRGTFIIDDEGKVRAKVIHDLQVGRSIDEHIRVLKAFQTGELCPVNWEKGQETLGKDS
jgi:alkyl hydroperoxide reductase subunit AhpC